MARVVVIGCGNPDAGDDAVGLLAVREARTALERVPGVRVVEAGIGLAVVDLLEDAEAAVVVDAVRTPRGGRAPGELVRAEAGPDGLPAEVGSALSSHGFGVLEAIGLAAALGGAPRVVLVGVEAGEVEMGRPLSPPVADALPELVRTVLAEAERLAGGA